MKKVFKLGYIHCAGCSVALQDKISKVENVKSAQINFVTRLVTVEIENRDSKTTMQNIEKAIHEFDKTIQILPADGKEQTQKSDIINYCLLGVSVFLWVLGIVLQHTINQLYIHLPIYLISFGLVGYKVLWGAGKNIIKGKMLDETFLMSIATIGAFVIGEYLEGCAVIIFYTVGEIFQKLATKKSEDKIKALADLKSVNANLLKENGEVEVVAIETIRVGDIICVNAGEKVPLDGTIINGGANFNTSAITGESAGIYLSVNSEVFSGYIVEDGSVEIKVSTTYQNCTVSKIVQMVEEASASKANAEKFIAKFAKIYTPIVVGLALAVCFVPPIFYGYTLEVFKVWAYRGLSFLVVSCPCALVLSVPLTYFAGVGAAAKSGVLVKGSNYLEYLSKIDVVCFDKTGTLTTGDFKVTNIVACAQKEESDILELVSYAESFSNHRIAKSIVEYYKQTTGKTINTAWVQDYKEIAGYGISANIFMENCLVGNKELLVKNKVEFTEPNTHETVVYLVVNGVLEGYICLSDELKPEAKTCIEQIKKQGLKTYILTGDKDQVAQNIATELGLNGYFSELKPADKVAKLQELHNNKKIAFIGDGINDAPVLSQVDVGIAMGGAGSDIAVQSADIVLLTDELGKINEIIKIAKNTQKIVLQNVIFTIGFKIATMLLVSFGLAGMWLAVFADVGVTVLAVLNSLRAMKRYNKNKTKKAKV